MSLNTCIICLEDATLADSLVLHNHPAHCHRRCLTEWTKTNATCPLCRLKISKHSAVEITAAEEDVLKNYSKLLDIMLASERVLYGSMHENLTEISCQPPSSIETDTTILVEKTDYHKKLKDLYKAHEHIYDILETHFRGLRNDETADLEMYRRIYADRIAERIVC